MQTLTSNLQFLTTEDFIAHKPVNAWSTQDYNRIIACYLTLAGEDGGLTLTSLRQLAKTIGIESPEKITASDELVRLIQIASAHRACFRNTASQFCPEKTCVWRTECQKLTADWCR